MSIRTALNIANAAAGIVVAKVGTYPVHRRELSELWSHRQQYIHREPYRSLTIQDMADRVRMWQDKGETVVFTNGVFDILHRGHVLYCSRRQLWDSISLWD